MRKKCRFPLGDCRGFTLAEVMMTVLILVMVTAVVTAGIPVAQRAYTDIVDGANAEVLLSTTLTALRSELDTVEKVALTDGNKVDYFESVCRRCYMRLVNVTVTDGDKVSNDGIGLQVVPPIEGSEPMLLVSRAAATKRLHTEFGSIVYQDGVFKIKGLVVKNASGTVLAGDAEGETEYIIRPLNPVTILGTV